MGLKELVRKHIDQYLEELDGEIPQDLYDLVVGEVEHAFSRLRFIKATTTNRKQPRCLASAGELYVPA